MNDKIVMLRWDMDLRHNWSKAKMLQMAEEIPKLSRGHLNQQMRHLQVLDSSILPLEDAASEGT